MAAATGQVMPALRRKPVLEDWVVPYVEVWGALDKSRSWVSGLQTEPLGIKPSELRCELDERGIVEPEVREDYTELVRRIDDHYLKAAREGK